MPSGVSTPGFQVVEFDRPRTSTYLFAKIGNEFASVPRRVGYYYVMIQGLGPPPNRVIVAQGILHEPGLYVSLPILETTDGDVYRCVVNWNRGGETWFFDIG